MEKYQAEPLVYRHVPTNLFTGLACYDDSVILKLRDLCKSAGVEIHIQTRPEWYF